MPLSTRLAIPLRNLAYARNLIEKRIETAPQIEGIALAAPLKRWLASATDALILLVAHLIVLTPFAYFAPDQLAVLNVAAWVSPCASWAYLWWGWARGQTPGQRIWRVRVIGDDGQPMTAGRAFKRALGYALVCLSFKIGLLPIFFDPLRRGWHDRFAATLVVDARAPVPQRAVLREAFGRTRQAEERKRRAHPLPVTPDFSAARRGWPLVFAAYLLLSVALTWPVAAQWNVALAGDGGDAWVFVWNNWFFAHALETGAPLLSTDLLFQGFQTPLLFHTMNWFDCVLAWPLLCFFSPVETYNLLFLLTPALCALAAYWLACSLTRARLASFIVAPVFGFSPYFMAHGLGHANLTSAQMLPIFAGLFYGALLCQKARYALGAGVALALAGLCDWQYLLFGSVIASGLWAGVEWSLARAGQRFGGRRAGLAIGALVCAGVLLSPLLVPLLRENANASYMSKSGQAGGFSASLGDWTRAGKLHPVLNSSRATNASNENDLAPGWCILALCAFGLASRKRHQLAPFWWASGAAFVLACGPFLSLFWKELVPLIGLGAPGNGLGPPWNTVSLVTISNRFALDLSLIPFGQSSIVEMPFSWLAPHVPMLKAFRVPARLAVVVLMCCAPLAAAGLNRLFDRLRPRHRALLAPFALFIGFEYSTYPYPTSDIAVPAFYQQIARAPRHYAVADVPLMISPRYAGWQTVHGKSTLVGIVARCPPQAFALPARNPLLRALSTRPFELPGQGSSVRPDSNFDYGPALRELREQNVRYLVVHKTSLVQKSDRQMQTLLDRLHLPLAFEDADTRVYQIMGE